MKNPVALGASALSFAASLLGAGAVQATEQPRYDVVDKVAAFEVRRYGPRLAAEVTVSGSAEGARNAGFRKLAAYIFGGNRTRASIAMTAPVVQSARGPSESIAMTAPVVQSGDSAGGLVLRSAVDAALPAPQRSRRSGQPGAIAGPRGPKEKPPASENAGGKVRTQDTVERSRRRYISGRS